jgi:hypothetical protein
MGAVGGGLGGAMGGASAAVPTAGAGSGLGAGAGATTGATVGAGTTAAGTTAGLGGSAGSGLTSTFTPATTSSLFGGAGQGVGTATQLGSSIAGGGSGVAGGGFGAMGGAGSSTGIAGSQAASGFGGGAGALPGNFTGYAPQLSNTALGITAGTGALAGAMGAEQGMYGMPPSEEYDGPLSKLRYDPNRFTASTPIYAPDSVYRPTYAADGGIMQAFQSGGPVERMSQMNTAMNPQGGMYPMGMIDKTQYATPIQLPVNAEVVSEVPAYERSNPMLMAKGGVARYAPGGMIDPSMGMAAQQSSQQSMGSQGIDALMGNKKRMLTKEQMDAVKMQGMSKGAMQDVYGEMAAKGLNKGGPAGNKDMAAVDAYVAAAQSGNMALVMAKAQAGDYNAMIALNKVRKTPNQNYAKGGQLGGYSDGGRMLKGPGDGMSDSIPGVIANKQPARLADGEFVVPADVVSHLGNGSTDAGAKQLYAMMDRVRKARTGNSKQGKQIKPAKYMAA